MYLTPPNVAHIVNADDVPVRDLAGQQQLALEAAVQVGGRPRIRGGFRANDLEGDRHGQLVVPRVVHLAHAAGAEQLDDLIPGAERLSGHESAGAGRRRDRADVRRLRQVVPGGLPDVAQLCRRRARPRAVVSGRGGIRRDRCGDRRGDVGRDRGAANRAAAARRGRIASAARADHQNWNYGAKTAGRRSRDAGSWGLRGDAEVDLLKRRELFRCGPEEASQGPCCRRKSFPPTRACFPRLAEHLGDACAEVRVDEIQPRGSDAMEWSLNLRRALAESGRRVPILRSRLNDSDTGLGHMAPTRSPVVNFL